MLIGERPPFLGDVISKLTGDIAAKIAQEVSPQIRVIVAEERTRLADSVIKGLPFAGAGALTAIGTAFLVPSTPGKIVGYATSAALVGLGVYTAFSRMATMAPAKRTSPKGPPISIPGVDVDIDAAIERFLTHAEPRMREIIRRERELLSDALKVGLPFHVAALLAAIGTMFVVPADTKTIKVVGYTLATLLFGAGLWRTFDRLKTEKPPVR